MGVTVEFILPDEILRLVLEFTCLSEAEQDEILAIVGGQKDSGGTKQVK